MSEENAEDQERARVARLECEQIAKDDWARTPINAAITKHGDGLANTAMILSACVMVGFLLFNSIELYLAVVALWISILASCAALLRYLAHGRSECARMDRFGKYLGLSAAVFAAINGCIALLFVISKM
jgi:hypothetical protein